MAPKNLRCAKALSAMQKSVLVQRSRLKKEVTARLMARFWELVDKTSGNKCWIWRGILNRKGYGSFYMCQRTERAHRVSWWIANGKIPLGLLVLHICDNAACVNPNHLYLGTDMDNTRDKFARGRVSPARGERNGMVKHPESRQNGEKCWMSILTNDDVFDMRSRRRQGESTRSLSIEYGVAQSTVRSVVSGRTWKHLPPPPTAEGERR